MRSLNYQGREIQVEGPPCQGGFGERRPSNGSPEGPRSHSASRSRLTPAQEIGLIDSCALQFSHQKQDEQDNDYKSKPTASIITGAVERPAADSAKAPEERYNLNNQYYGSDRHDFLHFKYKKKYSRNFKFKWPILFQAALISIGVF